MMKLFTTHPTRKHFFLMWAAAFVLRASTFFLYVQHQEYYHQADSIDYHNCAALIAYTKTMTFPHNGEPIFWRTPGYPLFLAPFYHWHGCTYGDFSAYGHVHKSALWFQLFLCSFIPLILFFLALQLTNSLPIAWITSLISVVHLGFVLASCYLLTDGLGSIFFYLFLLFFYRIFFLVGEPKNNKQSWIAPIILGTCSLAIYTWMRPMGKFVGICALLLLLISHNSFKEKLKRIILFSLIFFGMLAPWYIRNYQLTGKLFFCPMSGAYLQAFCAPKIIRRMTGMSLDEAVQRLCIQVYYQTNQEQAALDKTAPGLVASKYFVCGKIAWPWIKMQPWHFVYDWIVQCLKTTFDLYSCQLVAFARNSFTYDPMEEFLTTKTASCLYEGTLPLPMRIISWIELFFSLGLWIGLFGGFWRSMVTPLYNKLRHSIAIPSLTYLWLKTIPLIAAVIIMTGGFGYARLRIPVEPLMIILALTFYYQTRQRNTVKGPA